MSAGELYSVKYWCRNSVFICYALVLCQNV